MLSKLVEVRPALKLVQVKVFRKGLRSEDRVPLKDLPCVVEVSNARVEIRSA